MIGALFLQGLRQRVHVQIQDLAQRVALRAAELAPRDGGALADSISAEETAVGANIVCTAPYAQVIELGTYRRAAQPFLRPALMEERND